MMLVHAVTIGLLTVSSGCATQPQERADSAASDVRSEADILYASILKGFEAEGIEVALQHPESRVVVSSWAELNTELRRRYVSRVVQAGKGLLLRVVAEYERRDRTGQTPMWVPAEDPHTAERARREEAELGTAIQAAFKRLSR